MCDTFSMYSRRVNGLGDVKGCSILSTSELSKLRGDLIDALKERNDAVLFTIPRLHAELAELRSENRQLKHRIELLSSELGQLRDEANAFWRNEEEPANAN